MRLQAKRVVKEFYKLVKHTIDKGGPDEWQEFLHKLSSELFFLSYNAEKDSCYLKGRYDEVLFGLRANGSSLEVKTPNNYVRPALMVCLKNRFGYGFDDSLKCSSFMQVPFIGFGR